MEDLEETFETAYMAIFEFDSDNDDDEVDNEFEFWNNNTIKIIKKVIIKWDISWQ